MLIPIGGLLRQVNISEAHISERKVIYSPEFSDWYEFLSKREKFQVNAWLKHLELSGPKTGRPAVEHIKGSRFQKMIPMAERIYSKHLEKLEESQ